MKHYKMGATKSSLTLPEKFAKMHISADPLSSFLYLQGASRNLSEQEGRPNACARANKT